MTLLWLRCSQFNFTSHLSMSKWVSRFAFHGSSPSSSTKEAEVIFNKLLFDFNRLSFKSISIFQVKLIGTFSGGEGKEGKYFRNEIYVFVCLNEIERESESGGGEGKYINYFSLLHFASRRLEALIVLCIIATEIWFVRKKKTFFLLTAPGYVWLPNMKEEKQTRRGEIVEMSEFEFLYTR